ncbi:MgtC/SapB family protein [Paenibacillus sp. P96]|uniref:MgtC/SapB family protein n=1 Tax=Paenibacillus zeirhizosphaerae TaxID=2987519 RepID=A0ABT9FUG1_9BACL|nr:MgtC/SapB family protein [Paenibacillus sp. P96]MDP4098097.1 MgtC/SapB family protein [Paenibacillus sp. P96]
MGDPWVIDNSHIMIRLLLAVLLGGLIGFERERSNHAAGLRTHILVCLGSSLIMMLSIYGFAAFVREPSVRIDPARLATAVITGVGFLGAGTILFTGKSITGLTTAASIWVVAAIGLGTGAGFYFASVASTVLVLLTLWTLNKLEQRYLRGQKPHQITLYGLSSPGLLDQVSTFLEQEEIKVKKVSVKEHDNIPFRELHPEGRNVEVSLEVLARPGFDPLRISAALRQWEDISAVIVE